MPTVRVIALKDHVYDAVERRKDQVYEAQEKHIPVLVAIGHAKLQESDSRRTYKRRDMEAEK